MATDDPAARLARLQLTTASLSDTLDGLGLLHQIMASHIRPLDERTILCGRARTGSYRAAAPEEPDTVVYEPVVAMVDALRPGDVMVLACEAGYNIQPWGELATEGARMRGAMGCVTDGLMRDVRQIRALGFPVFSAGYGVIQTRGRGVITSVDEPVHCGDVAVSPGDLVFGDVDGIVVIPQEAEEEVLRLAFAHAARERELVQTLEDGVTIDEVYRRFGTI